MLQPGIVDHDIRLDAQPVKHLVVREIRLYYLAPDLFGHLFRGVGVQVEHGDRGTGPGQPLRASPPDAARPPVTSALRPLKSAPAADGPGTTEVSFMLLPFFDRVPTLISRRDGARQRRPSPGICPAYQPVQDDRCGPGLAIGAEEFAGEGLEVLPESPNCDLLE